MSPFGIGSTYLSQEKGLASAGVEQEGLPFNAHGSFQSSRAHPYTPENCLDNTSHFSSLTSAAIESYSYLRIADLSVKAQSRSGLGLGSGAPGILGRA